MIYITVVLQKARTLLCRVQQHRFARKPGAKNHSIDRSSSISSVDLHLNFLFPVFFPWTHPASSLGLARSHDRPGPSFLVADFRIIPDFIDALTVPTINVIHRLHGPARPPDALNDRRCWGCCRCTATGLLSYVSLLTRGTHSRLDWRFQMILFPFQSPNAVASCASPRSSHPWGGKRGSQSANDEKIARGPGPVHSGEIIFTVEKPCSQCGAWWEGNSSPPGAAADSANNNQFI